MPNVIVNLAITAAIYGSFPLVFSILRKDEIKREKLRLYCVLYTVLVALIFVVFDCFYNVTPNFSPAVIWGIIFYKISLHIIKKRELLAILQKKEIEPKEIVFSYKSNFEEKQDKEKTKREK